MKERVAEWGECGKAGFGGPERGIFVAWVTASALPVAPFFFEGPKTRVRLSPLPMPQNKNAMSAPLTLEEESPYTHLDARRVAWQRRGNSSDG